MLRAQGLTQRILARGQRVARSSSGRSVPSASAGAPVAPTSPLWDHAEAYPRRSSATTATASATKGRSAAEAAAVGQEVVILGQGRLAGLAHGAVVGRDGDSVVLATVVSDRVGSAEGGGGGDGTPFNVDYKEKPAASGRLPRTPNRREMPNVESEILTGRAIDRCLRPLFPPLFASETGLTCSVQSFDPRQPEPPVSLAANAASAALHASDVPWLGPVGCVRVGLVNGCFVGEPSKAELAASSLDLLYAGTEGGSCLMVEVAAQELPARVVKDALRFAQAQLGPIIAAQRRLRDASSGCGSRPKRAASPYQGPSSGAAWSGGGGSGGGIGSSDGGSGGGPSGLVGDLSGHQRGAAWNPLEGRFCGGSGDVSGGGGSPTALEAVRLAAARLDGGEARAIFELALEGLPDADGVLGAEGVPGAPERGERAFREASFTARLVAALEAEMPAASSGGGGGGVADWRPLVQFCAHERLWLGMREALLDAHFRATDSSGNRSHGRGIRCDGRALAELRPLQAHVGVLPRAHGSSLFSRGNTQVLATATLGPASDALDPLERSHLGGPLVGASAGSTAHLSSLDAPGAGGGVGAGGGCPPSPARAAAAAAAARLRRLFLHYEFPSFSTGEVASSGGGPNRRALGHGNLAQKVIRNPRSARSLGTDPHCARAHTVSLRWHRCGSPRAPCFSIRVWLLSFASLFLLHFSFSHWLNPPLCRRWTR